MFTQILSLVIVAVNLSHAFPRSSKEKIGIPDSSSEDDEIKTKVLLDVIEDMEPSVNPCDDFFTYSCGNWIKNNPIPKSKTSYNRFSQLSEQTSKMLTEFVSQLPSTGEETGDSMLKMKQFYDSCMAIDEPVGDITSRVKSLITDFGSWPIDEESFDVDDWSLQDTLISVSRNLSIQPMYHMSVSPNLHDTTKHIMTVDQRRFYPSRVALTSNEKIYVEQRKALLEFQRTLAKYFGATNETLHYVDQAFEVLKELAKASLPMKELRKFEKNYKMMTVAELERRSGMPNRWLERLLDLQIIESGGRITSGTKIGTMSADYVRQAYEIVTSRPKGVQATLIIVSFLMSISSHLPLPFRNSVIELSRKIHDVKEEQPRNETCIENLKTHFKFAIGKLFVDKKFDQDAKDSVDEMIEGVRENLIKVLNAAPWMDEKTKSAGIEKAEFVNKNIGYPEMIKSKSKMDTYYSKAHPNKENFFENVFKMGIFNRRRQLSKFGKPVDKTEWSHTPAMVNAFYDLTSNRMLFPAGIFQAPFFRKEATKSMNYGAIGAVVGHEIIHGFDSAGRLFDKYGTMKSWWSDKSVKEFKKKTKCLIDQYSIFSKFNKTNKGEQTITETTADNGGLKLALAAYEDYVEANGEEIIPDGIQFTPRQLFFIGNAQVWCSNAKRSAAIDQIDSGYHPLGEFRISGIVQNSAEFAKAFSCPKGSKMNPNRERCVVW